MRLDMWAIVAGVVFSLIWSSAFTSARIIVAEAPPLLILSLRYAISGSLAVGIALALGQSMRLTGAQWRATIVFGLAQNSLYLGLNFQAMQTVEAGLAAIIASTLPLCVGFASWTLFRERLGVVGIIGLIAGTLGAVLVMGSRVGTTDADLFGIVLCCLGVLSLTAATLLVRTATSGGNLLMIVGLQMWAGCVPLAVLGGLFETWDVTWTLRLTAAFTYTLLVPGLIATLIWFWLVGRVGPVRAATYHFLNPFFGVAIAALLLGEALSLYDGLGVLIIMGAIIIVQRARISG